MYLIFSLIFLLPCQSLNANKTNSERSSLGQLIFIADQLAHFPYTVLDEICYVAYNIEQRVSVLGSSVLQRIYQSLHSSLRDIAAIRQNPDAQVSSEFKHIKEPNESYLRNLLDECEEKLPKQYNNDKCMKSNVSDNTDDAIYDESKPDKDPNYVILQQLFNHCPSETLRSKARYSLIMFGPSCLLLTMVRRFLLHFYGLTER